MYSVKTSIIDSDTETARETETERERSTFTCIQNAIQTAEMKLELEACFRCITYAWTSKVPLPQRLKLTNDQVDGRELSGQRLKLNVCCRAGAFSHDPVAL